MRQYSGRATVRKHKCGRWQGVVRFRDVSEDGECGKWHFATKLLDAECFPDPEGTPKDERDMRGERTARAEAKRWLRELEAGESARDAIEKAEEHVSAERSGWALTKSSTVAEYVAYYLSVRLPSLKDVEASTMAGYRRCARHVAKDYGGATLGSVPLCEVKRADVLTWLGKFRKDYAPTTVRCTLRLLKSAMEEAQRDGWIKANPVDGVSAPTVIQEPVTWLKDGERMRLLADLDADLTNCTPGTSRYRCALGTKVILCTGMRPQEVCGLRWARVTIEGDGDGARSATVDVREAIGRSESSFYLKTPKSAAARRRFPFSDASTDGLATDLARYAEVVSASAPKSQDVGRLFVIGDIDGSYQTPALLNRAWSRRAARLNLRNSEGGTPRLYDLRHTFGTVAAHSGIPETSLKDLMGHTSITVTHRYYVGVDDDANARAMETIGRALIGGAEVVPFRKTGTEA